MFTFLKSLKFYVSFQIKCWFPRSPAYFELLSFSPRVPHYWGNLVRGQECGYALMGCGKSFTECIKITSQLCPQAELACHNLFAIQHDGSKFSSSFWTVNGSTFNFRHKYISHQFRVYKILKMWLLSIIILIIF